MRKCTCIMYMCMCTGDPKPQHRPIAHIRQARPVALIRQSKGAQSNIPHTCTYDACSCAYVQLCMHMYMYMRACIIVHVCMHACICARGQRGRIASSFPMATPIFGAFSSRKETLSANISSIVGSV